MAWRHFCEWPGVDRFRQSHGVWTMLERLLDRSTWFPFLAPLPDIVTNCKTHSRSPEVVRLATYCSSALRAGLSTSLASRAAAHGKISEKLRRPIWRKR